MTQTLLVLQTGTLFYYNEECFTIFKSRQRYLACGKCSTIKAYIVHNLSVNSRGRYENNITKI